MSLHWCTKNLQASKEQFVFFPWVTIFIENVYNIKQSMKKSSCLSENRNSRCNNAQQSKITKLQIEQTGNKIGKVVFPFAIKTVKKCCSNTQQRYDKEKSFLNND